VDDFAATFGISSRTLLECLVFCLLDDHSSQALEVTDSHLSFLDMMLLLVSIAACVVQIYNLSMLPLLPSHLFVLIVLESFNSYLSDQHLFPNYLPILFDQRFTLYLPWSQLLQACLL
jgi:hypothetical protein